MSKIWQKFKYFGTTVKNQHFIHEELRRDRIRGMLANIPFRLSCFPACNLETESLNYTKLYFYLLFCVGVKLGLSL
jgi:hypothetical protein